MKILHTAYTRNPSPGIVRQMEMEQTAAHRLEIPWKSSLFAPKAVNSDIVIHATTSPRKRLLYKIEYYNWLKSQQNKYDVLLLRNSKLDPLQYFFLATSTKPVYTVHHTLEGHQFHSEKRKFASQQKWVDDYLISLCFRHTSGIIAVTNEIAKYELIRSDKNINTIIYPNGVDTVAHLPEGSLEIVDDCPEILFVASQFLDWHGLDLVLERISQSNENLKLHIVGELTPEQQNLASKDSRYIIHGLLTGEKIRELSKICVIGLGSFALYRKNMFEVCSLKVRDYLSLGLPVYAGNKDVFNDTMKFYRYSDFSVHSLLEFIEYVAGSPRIGVYIAAKNWIDKGALLDKLYKQLMDIHAGPEKP